MHEHEEQIPFEPLREWKRKVVSSVEERDQSHYVPLARQWGTWGTSCPSVTQQETCNIIIKMEKKKQHNLVIKYSHTVFPFPRTALTSSLNYEQETPVVALLYSHFELIVIWLIFLLGSVLRWSLWSFRQMIHFARPPSIGFRVLISLQNRWPGVFCVLINLIVVRLKFRRDSLHRTNGDIQAETSETNCPVSFNHVRCPSSQRHHCPVLVSYHSGQ